MKRLPLLLAAGLAACSSANVAVKTGFDFSKVRRVGVVGFRDYPNHQGSGAIVTGAFEQALLVAGYSVVERDQVARVMAEKKLSGSLETKDVKTLGRVLGVDALLMGQITDFAAPRERMVKTDVVDERLDPIYVRRTRQVRQPDGSIKELEETVIDGYKPTRIIRQEPRNYTVDGRLGLAARLVHVGTGEILWSGSDSTRAYTFEDSARGLADGILRAVKRTWPAAR